MNLAWYARRLASMRPAEVAGRVRDKVVAQRWRRRQVHDMAADTTPVPVGVRLTMAAPPVSGIAPDARSALLGAAHELLVGRWPVFDRWRDDMAPAPDWHLDPRTGRTAPRSAYCFEIDHRDEAVIGNVKYVWEPSRHTSCTMLAAAYHLTGHEPYAQAAAAQLRSWWDDNPFLSGIHWTSGIELGLRLIAWVWIRRLLSGWAGVTELFEGDPRFLRQLHHHQEYLATFRSRGSSANNHVIAEAAGQFAAAAAFEVFAESPRWRRDAARILRRELPRQVFACGLHRELATEYHGFVLELALVAAVEGDVQGHPLGDDVWQPLCRMTDALAALVDEQVRPPRQGDGDQGHGLLVDAPDYDRWSSLLATGERLFGELPWWPEFRRGDVRTAVLAGLVACPGGAPPRAGGRGFDRPRRRPSLFADAGQVILRDLPPSDGHAPPQLWCRFDAGPHGFLGIAAHAHADALSLEVRDGGVEILADPGTYCYHGEPEWRTYFRSTAAHNTLELAGVDPSVMGGPFLWTRTTDAELLTATGLDAGSVARAVARHDGYRRLRPPAIHQRTVTLDRVERSLTVTDEVMTDGAHPSRLSFHLGPDVGCTVDGPSALLSWHAAGSSRWARMDLPPELTWSQVRGAAAPLGGWYAPGLDRRMPTTTLIGSGTIAGGARLVTTLRFAAPARPDIDTAAAYSNQPTT
jgi:hypothetical protein